MRGLSLFLISLLAIEFLLSFEFAFGVTAKKVPIKDVALTGVLDLTANSSAKTREKTVIEAVKSGNIPSHLKGWVKVSWKQKLKSTTTKDSPFYNVAIWVKSDYLSIGKDGSFVRMPVSFDTAKTLAIELGWEIPTRKIVDKIYSQASRKLAPQPLTPGPRQVGNEYYQFHNQLIEEQWQGRGKLANMGESGSKTSINDRNILVAGHKKDLVVTKKLLSNPDREAIYGWHRLDGRAIQPLSMVHGYQYVDYSHGIRFVAPTVEINQEKYDYRYVLANPQLASLLSDEGIIPVDKILGGPSRFVRK